MRGGGLAITSHKSIHHISILTSVYSTLECIGSYVSLSTFSFKIFNLSTSFIINFAFCPEFEPLLENHVTSNVDLIFVCDFNIHIEKHDDPNGILFNTLLLAFNLNQHISSPTHDSGHILDLIILNVSSKLAIYPSLVNTCISKILLYISPFKQNSFHRI